MPRGVYPRLDKAVRFAHFVLPGASENDCFRWLGGTNKRGYGKFWDEGHTRGAHVVAWEIANGPVPAGMEVCHTCDNPPCTNVRHLFLGTPLDNQLDMAAKGRQVSGNAVLCAEAIIALRQLRRSGNYTIRELAANFGVTTSTGWQAATGRSWARFSWTYSH